VWASDLPRTAKRSTIISIDLAENTATGCLISGHYFCVLLLSPCFYTRQDESCERAWSGCMSGNRGRISRRCYPPGPVAPLPKTSLPRPRAHDPGRNSVPNPLLRRSGCGRRACATSESTRLQPHAERCRHFATFFKFARKARKMTPVQSRPNDMHPPNSPIEARSRFAGHWLAAGRSFFHFSG
jgi:hypothetical protein